jgi:hypothetical protein
MYTIWKVLRHIHLCHKFVEKSVSVIIAASFQQRFRRSLYSVLICLSDMSLWCVSLICLSDVSLWYVSLMCLSDVSLWCVSLICLSDVSLWYVSLICLSDVSLWYVSLICLSDMSLWWRLFQKCVVLTILDIYVLITSCNLQFVLTFTFQCLICI